VHTNKQLAKVQLPAPFPPLGPLPTIDEFSYSVAIAMLLKYLEPGRYATTQQYETIRKLRAGFSNVYLASVPGLASLRLTGGDKPQQLINDCPTNSFWFERFGRGCLSRMGQIIRQDRAVLFELLHALCSMLELEWEAATHVRDRLAVASLGAFSVIAFCGSFRGPELFLVDLHGLIKYGEEQLISNGIEYVIVPLLGRFKTELGEQYHLTPMVATARSGLQIKMWIQRVLQVKQEAGLSRGPAFVGPTPGSWAYGWYERELLERFQQIQGRKPEIIPPDVAVLEEYGLSRSFRRGATSEAKARGTQPDDVDLANRWHTFKGAKGKRPRLAMRDHYADIHLLIPALIRFSVNM